MKIRLLFFLLMLGLSSKSQDKGSFYLFNADWQNYREGIDSPSFILHIHQMNDSCWQWDFYNFKGPLIKTAQYRDSKGKELNGISHYYNERGWLDSIAVYQSGKKHGNFYKLATDTFNYKIKYKYQDDSLIEVVYYDDEKKDSGITYKDEKESEYPGGLGQWSRYLGKNLQYPDRALNFNITGDVRILFIVDIKGQVLEPYVARSIEYSLDDASLNIIRKSGKWTPAFQNGKFVKSYKIQPIQFRLQER